MMDPAYFIDQSGQTIAVKADEGPAMVQAGFVAASPKQIHDYVLQEKYGSPGQQIATGAESAASALTFGVSDLVERAAGVPAEDIRGREEANPIASGVGTAIGVAAPLLLSGGASGFTAPSLIARAGKAAGEAVELGAAGSTLSRLAKAAAGSAVEGAFYGTGQVVHESVLGDPSLTAESVLATVGLSTAIGGALGLGGGALSILTGKATSGAFGAKVADMLSSVEGHANLNSTNAMPSVIKGVIRGKGEEGALALAKEAREIGILRNITDTPDAILDRAESVKTEIGEALTLLADTADQVNGAGAGGSTIATWSKVYQDVRGPIMKELMAHGDTVPIAAQFDKVLSDFAQANAGRDLNTGALWELRQSLDRFVYRNGKVLDPWVREINTPINRVRSHVSKLLEEGIEKGTGKQGIDAWNAANRRYEVASTFSMLADSGIQRNAANNAVHLTGMMGAAAGLVHGGPLGGMALGAASEAVRRQGAAGIGWAASALRKAGVGTAAASVIGRTSEAIATARRVGIALAATSTPESVITLAALERNNTKMAGAIDSAAKDLVGGAKNAGEAASLSLADFRKRTQEMVRLANSPEALHSAIVGLTEGMDDHAPKTAQALQATAARAVAFLASKVPQHPKGGPLDAAWTPSRAEIDAYGRYDAAVHDPASVVRQGGAASREGMEALRAVYPALHQRMHGAVATHLAAHLESVPYRAQAGLTQLLGQPMSSTWSPHALLRFQSGFSVTPPQTPRPRPAQTGKMTTGKMAATEMQRTATRGMK